MRQERKKTKKRNKGRCRRTVKNANRLRGGKPKFIKTIAYYDETPGKEALVDYKIIQGNMDIDQQRKYADKHKVYYPIETPSMIDEIFGSVDPHKIRLMTKNYFSLPGKPKVGFSRDEETVVIHEPEDIEKIRITNKMLMNHYVFNKLMENLKKIPPAKLIRKKKGGAPTKDQNEKLREDVVKYNEFISKNKDALLNGITTGDEQKVAESLLKSPVFFNIIAVRQGIVDKPFGDLDLLKNIIEKPNSNIDEFLKNVSGSLPPGPSLSGSSPSGPSPSEFDKETRVLEKSLKKHMEEKNASIVPASDSSSASVNPPVKQPRRNLKSITKEAISKIDVKGNADILKKAVDASIAREGGLTEEQKRKLKEAEDLRKQQEEIFKKSVASTFGKKP